MVIEIEIYNTLELAKQAKARNSQRHLDGFRPLHTNFINEKYEVTFVKGTDDPHNAPDVVAQREAEQLKKDRDTELKQKAKDKTLTKDESEELLERLSELL